MRARTLWPRGAIFDQYRTCGECTVIGRQLRGHHGRHP